jgi:oligo-1,6-glucosidase
VLVYGKYTLLDKDNPDVYAYTREWKGVRWLVVLNFTSRPVPMPAPVSGAVSPAGAKLMIDNYASAGKAGELRPYEAAVYALP